MILFPLGEPIFADLGPDGLSMFYVSCIISQLTFSFGGSAFKGGIGSEMVVTRYIYLSGFVLTDHRLKLFPSSIKWPIRS